MEAKPLVHLLADTKLEGSTALWTYCGKIFDPDHPSRDDTTSDRSRVTCDRCLQRAEERARRTPRPRPR